MKQHTATATILREERRGPAERIRATDFPRRPRKIRARTAAAGDGPIFVDRGRRRLAIVVAAAVCVVALALWWAMLFLAFGGSTSGSSPRLVDAGAAVEAVHTGAADDRVDARSRPRS